MRYAITNMSGAHNDHEPLQRWINAQMSDATKRTYAQVGERFVGLRRLTFERTLRPESSRSLSG